jgi:hypothetical protein
MQARISETDGIIILHCCDFCASGTFSAMIAGTPQHDFAEDNKLA